MDAMTRFRTILIVAASVLTATVAGLAFWVSFEAISIYAVRIKAFPEHLGWAAPLLVDSFTLLGTAFLLWLALSGQRLRKVFDHWYAWALVVIATAASAYLNFMHVPADAPPEAAWVAGAVPVTLLLAVHLLVLLLLRLLAWTPAQTVAGMALLATEAALWADRAEALAARGRSIAERFQPSTPEPIRETARRVGEKRQQGAPTRLPAAAVKSAPGAKDTERSRIARDLLSADRALSGRDLGKAWKAAGVGASNEKAYEVLRALKAEGNGSAPEQSAEVLR